MLEKDLKTRSVMSHQRLTCTDVLGGIRNREVDVSAGRVMGSIYSSSSEGEQGGDIYYFGVCRGDEITRLAIADVAGHGDAVSKVSQFVYETLQTYM